MKRKILVCAACFTIAGIYANAQTKSTIAAPPPPAPPLVVLAPPPPPPPPIPPPAPTLDPIAPPAPPLPPITTLPPHGRKGIAIINSNGYDISIRSIKGTAMVFAKKDAKTQKIKLSTWNTSRKYYEKKYGHLPPPPPPEELRFTPPAIIQDIH